MFEKFFNPHKIENVTICNSYIKYKLLQRFIILFILFYIGMYKASQAYFNATFILCNIQVKYMYIHTVLLIRICIT
jgi:hypothetical protein